MTDWNRSIVNPHGRGPYGTNEGDIWLMADDFQQRIKEEKGPEWRMVVEMLMRDGRVQECYYTTDNPEMVAAAEAGHVKYVAQWASRN